MRKLQQVGGRSACPEGRSSLSRAPRSLLSSVAFLVTCVGLACASGARGGAPTGSAGASAGGGGGGIQAGSTGSSGSGGQTAGASGVSGAAGTAGGGSTGSAGTDAGASDGPASAEGGTDADGGAATLTLPIVRNGLAVLEMGDLSFTVDPMMGARITSLKLGGDELLTDATANPMFWGSTLWTSPANDWLVTSTFVAQPEIDNGPYTMTVGADNSITAVSSVSTTANTKKTFVLTKVFHADLVNRAIVIDYKLTNMGTAAFNLSHWEVTRVFPNGLLFFQTGAIMKVDYLTQSAKVTQAQGYTWYDNSTDVKGQEMKAGTDSLGGFVAQVAPNPNGDLLFIKAFEPVTQANAPPGENPIEFYCNADQTYEEIEDLSAYAPIAPGATYTRTVTWYVRRLPVGTDRTPGSAALIAAMKSALGKN